MQAFGNDYVYIDAIHQHLDNLPELARFVSDRHFAIGSDGMVLICPSEKGDFRMRMFNPDGTEGEMCGNALRSVGKYVYDHRLTDKTDLVIETVRSFGASFLRFIRVSFIICSQTHRRRAGFIRKLRAQWDKRSKNAADRAKNGEKNRCRYQPKHSSRKTKQQSEAQ